MGLSTLLIVVGATALWGAARRPPRSTPNWTRVLSVRPRLSRAVACATWVGGTSLWVASHGWGVGLTLSLGTAMAALILSSLCLPLLSGGARNPT